MCIMLRGILAFRAPDMQTLPELHRDLPEQEYANRALLTRQELEREDLDALILSHEPNIRWLVGYHIMVTQRIKWMIAAVIFCRDADQGSVLMCATDATGSQMACVDATRYWDDSSQPPFTSYADPIKVLTDEIRRRGLKDKRIGMELGAGMRVDLPLKEADGLRDALPEAEIVDFAPSLWRLRSVKSEPEIERLREAARITMEGYRTAFPLMAEGMTEKQLASIIYAKWFELGADHIALLSIISSPPGNRYAHVGPSECPIPRGEIVNIDGGCVFKGYCADIYRLACVGPPPDDQRRLVDCIIEAKREMIAQIRPGAPCGHVYEAGERVMRSAGYGHLIPDITWGHSVGLDVHELPTITKGSEELIKKNMVFCVEPWTLDYSDWSQLRNFEDMIRVTADGTELLSPGLDDLYVCP